MIIRLVEKERVVAPRQNASNATTILYVIDTLMRGGAETSLLELASHMDRTNYRPLVCTLYQGETLLGDFQRAGVSVVPLGLAGKYSFYKAVRKLRSVIREFDVDLVHSSLFRGNQVGRVAGWLEGRTVVSSFTSVAYDSARMRWNPPPSRWKHRVLQFIDMFTARFATKFHCVSQTVMEANCRDLRIPRNKVEIIPRGRSLDLFHGIDQAELNERKSDLSLEGAFPVLLNVGRLISAKGQQLLIEAMPDICRDFPECRLLIAGEGPIRGCLETLVDRLDLQSHVQFLGQCADVPVLLKLADIFVFPSLYEGLPGALIEAAIAGCPIAASDIAMNREIVSDGETALLFDSGVTKAIHRVVIQLARDSESRSRMGRRAAKEAAHRFDIKRVSQLTGVFYDDVLRNHRHD